MARCILCAASVFSAMALIVSACRVSPSPIKTTIAAADGEAVAESEWLNELGYRPGDGYPMQPDARTGCPAIPVRIGAQTVMLMLDTGTARGFMLTDHAPAVPCKVLERSEELNADGSHRGWSSTIEVDQLDVLGQRFSHARGALSDWRLYSSAPFDGTVGLDFFQGRRITIDFRRKRVWASQTAQPLRLLPPHAIVLDLVAPPNAHRHTLYVRAGVNGREALVYLDTGYNVSFIDPDFASGLPVIERQGRFKSFCQRVPLNLAGHRLLLDDVRIDAIRRGPGFELPVAMTLGSDFLAHFAVTIDLREGKLILLRQK